MTDLYGLDPVAKLTELNGDLHQLTEHLTQSLDKDEYVLASVVGGHLYLCKPYDSSTDAKPHWLVTAEVGEGETGAWDSESDKASRQFPDGVYLADIIGSYERYIVETLDE